MALSKGKSKQLKIDCTSMTYEEFIGYYNNCLCMGLLERNGTVNINGLLYIVKDEEIHLHYCDVNTSKHHYEILLPSFVTHIDDNAFSYCNYLVEITGEGVKNIGHNCFTTCNNLKRANFPNVEYIGREAFYNCRLLEEIDLASCKSINNLAFSNCISLKEVNAPKLIQCGTSAFADCHSLVSCSLDSISFIRDYTFKHCYHLKKFYAPKISFGVRDKKRIKVTKYNAFNGSNSINDFQVDTFIGSFVYFHLYFDNCDLKYNKHIE